MQRYSYNEWEREGRLFSVFLSHVLKANVIVPLGPTGFGTAVLHTAASYAHMPMTTNINVNDYQYLQRKYTRNT